MQDSINILTFIALIGSGLIGGIFFAFSNFVMKALKQLPDSQAISAMNAINVTVLNRWFFIVFFGTGVVCLLLAILLLSGEIDTSQRYTLLGCALYLLGCIAVTVVFNVQLNNRLASVDPGTPSGTALWSHYLSRWTCWNTVRTFASLSAAAILAKGVL